MDLLNQLSSNLFIRNVLDTFGLGKPYSTQPGGFVPFFQYVIGPHDKLAYHLCFKKEPFAVRYKNEIFNKLCRYTVNDGRNYLTHHLGSYPDQEQFFDFLFDELTERLAGSYPRRHRIKLAQALDWVNGQRKQARQEEQPRAEVPALVLDSPDEIKPDISQDLRSFLMAFKPLLEDFTERPRQSNFDLDLFIDSLRPLFEDLIGSYTVGNITVNRPGQLKRVIQHLYLLHELNSDKNDPKAGVKLFPNFYKKDLACILRLHFKDCQNKELNTVQKEVSDIADEIDLDNPKVERLRKAMQDFHFGKV